MPNKNMSMMVVVVRLMADMSVVVLTVMVMMMTVALPRCPTGLQLCLIVDGVKGGYEYHQHMTVTATQQWHLFNWNTSFQCAFAPDLTWTGFAPHP